MRKRFVIKLDGMEGTMHELLKRGDAVNAILEVAVHAGAAVIQEIADANAPRGGSVVKQTTKRKPASVIVDIGPDREHWFYKFFETGATEHEITGNPLVFRGDAGIVVVRSVDHPGMVASPFLRPALDGQKDNAAAEVGRVLKTQL